MEKRNQDIVRKLGSLIKRKFFFCNSIDDKYYQFTEAQLDKLIEDICSSDSIEEYCKRGY